MPQQFHDDRRELLDILLQRGILFRSEDQPVLSRDGSSARWMLNSLAFTLETRGAELAGRCLLALLERFDGRQLATYGLIGTPILQSCILQSGGKYRGLLVRKEAKTYGAVRIIEGDLDPNEPVILVDDSIASGTAFREGCERLEKAGLRVEGGVCLVRFGWESGCADLQEKGYHLEAVYDVFEDIMANMPDEPDPVRNPTKIFPGFEWSETKAPGGLHPAELARVTMAEYLTTGRLLQPPARMNREYDSAGGAWVSLRSKSDLHDRPARDGFWHFPGETSWGAAEDVMRAALRAALKLPEGDEALRILNDSHIAVTLMTALEECTVGQLDNERYGIVVSSRERASVMGGALPNMPGIAGEFEQFEHARTKNGGLFPFEPYRIHRHGVAKFVEPGAPWQPTGVPTDARLPWHDPAICAPIAERARDIAISRAMGVSETTTPLRHSALPNGLDSLFITIYCWGRLCGCMGSPVTELDGDLRRLVQAALNDDRFAQAEADAPEAIAVNVSFLYDFLDLGEHAPEEIVRPLIPGRQVLTVEQNQRSGTLLPFFAAMNDLDRMQYVDEVIDKAGITRPPYSWQRYECVSWLADSEGTGRLEGAFKHRISEESQDLPRKLAALYSGYLLRHQLADGTFFGTFEPFRNRLHEGQSAPHLAHAAWVLARAHRATGDRDLQTGADKSLEVLIEGIRLSDTGVWLDLGQESPSVSELSFLLLALCELPRGDYRRMQARSVASTLWSRIDRHGRMTTHFRENDLEEACQDYFPGQALLALAAACEARLTEIDPQRLALATRYYRHRFRYQRDYGQVSWLMQAFSAWWRVTSDPGFAELVFEIGDWILGHQLEKSGGFITSQQPDTPGYTTALYLEGLGAGRRVAAALDPAREAQYRNACERGFRFLERLTIRPEHSPVLPNTDYAIGGLRQSLYASRVRTDFVQHALSAALEMHDPVADAGTFRETTMETTNA